jgi:hypothetical protein
MYMIHTSNDASLVGMPQLVHGAYSRLQDTLYRLAITTPGPAISYILLGTRLTASYSGSVCIA